MPASPRRQNFQTISWFWDLYQRKLLNLDPPYQRRSVWNQSFKNDFIDTVLLQYPAPALFLYEEVSPEGRSLYQVVDGKQRLTAVFQFAEGEFPVSEQSPLNQLRGKYFSDLSREDKTSFWTYQFPVEYLPTNDETIINTIFQRINKNTARLTRQELRHARFDGVFASAAERLADKMATVLPENFPRIEGQSKKQMKDVELVANLLLALEDGPRGYSQDELDQAFSDRDESWTEGAEIEARFEQTVLCISAIVANPPDDPLFKTRLRNQADFFSFFTAVDECHQAAEWNCADYQYSNRLYSFIKQVEDDAQRTSNQAALDYFKAARSNSNDSGPRKKRHEIITHVLKNTLNDYAGQDTEQV